MDRSTELKQCIEGYREERITLKKGKLTELELKLKPVFCDKLEYLIKDQLLKNRDLLGDIEILYLCRLLSSGYTESYECILGISNDQLFLDKNRSQTFWCPKHIYADLENDMKEVERKLRKSFVRIEEYELLNLKQLLLMDDWEVLKECFHKLVLDQSHMLTDSTLDFRPELKVMHGVYMDQLELITGIPMGRQEDEEV